MLLTLLVEQELRRDDCDAASVSALIVSLARFLQLKKIAAAAVQRASSQILNAIFEAEDQLEFCKQERL